MGTWSVCDLCDKDSYTEADPFVEVRVKRPSDPADLCCVMAGHASCMGVSADKARETPTGPGAHVHEKWAEYIESVDAAREGYLWLT